MADALPATEPVLAHVVPMLDALQCGALLLNRAGRIVHVNDRLCQMMRCERGDLLGRSLFEIYPEGHGRAVVQHALEHFAEPREQEFFVPRTDGVELPVIVSGRALQLGSGDADLRIITVIDISHQKKAEQELQERYSDISSLSDTVLKQALALKRYSQELEQRVQQRTVELHAANMESIYMLAVAAEAKDMDTGAHVRRIERSARVIAFELGLSANESNRMGYSAILHDVGKIHVPDEILRKPAPLTQEEWRIIREHPITGERILSRETFFDVARLIARSHHENWDGSGYPDGLAGDSIPLAARIVRVADVFDALTSKRAYKDACNPEDGAAAIELGRGHLFDPVIVDAFMRVFEHGSLHSPGGD